MEPLKRTRCDTCDNNLHRNSLSNHNDRVKHLQNFERIERNI